MTRGGVTKDRTDGPERKCIVTGEAQPKSGLIRFVVGPDGQVVPDVLGKLPGRGIWVSADRGAIETAVKKKMFARAARQPVEVPEDMAGLVEGILARHLVELIALARKSGLAISGFEKVRDWLDKGQVKVLIQAHDGSGRGKSKLWTPEGARFVGCLSADEIGQAFGRQTTVHAALATGGLAKRVVEEAQRLKGLRVDSGGQSPA
ncbi:50S ribosomal protein L7 [Oceanicola sp. 22II-s10i]|uniref:RNA-binding protein n=1 Tax=Oceanicola sp. 22II-s10i TaxID=1317116 RepID=UPI000B528200|nr:RNA-binding protein [Oceanicola sp. 22II-s10i]OWU86023.1 50S ribosomal protein L7 [Oceanicola sp. 22II-s10i]